MLGIIFGAVGTVVHLEMADPGGGGTEPTKTADPGGGGTEPDGFIIPNDRI